jgi:hypothetical protein
MHDGHAGHMGATPMHASAHMGDHGAPADDSNKPCTCLGAGCCAAIVGVPSLALVALREIPVRVVTVVAPARAIVAPFVAPEYSHPFANGPPASRST